ncbi:MAG: hypothetical protein AAGA58_06420 [Verrucomicrobiota bacterium]
MKIEEDERPPAASDVNPTPMREGSLKASSLTVSMILHGVGLFILGLIAASNLKPPPPELTIMSAGSSTKEMTVEKREFAKIHRSPSAEPSKATNVLASQSAAPISIPVFDTESTLPTFGTGIEFGKGFGMGGKGGGAKFFGSEAAGKRLAFIIDVSLSLSDRQFEMIKEELTKSLARLSSDVYYQVIFFSGPSWFAEAEYDEGRGWVIHDGQRFEWTMTDAGIHYFEPEDETRLYRTKWLKATKSNLEWSKARISRVMRSNGTDWKWPMVLALGMRPKPDTIFFLTDGSMEDGDKKVRDAIRLNDRTAGPRTRVNTISMMQPMAVEDLSTLAKRTGGVFTIIDQNGNSRQPEL